MMAFPFPMLFLHCYTQRFDTYMHRALHRLISVMVILALSFSAVVWSSHVFGFSIDDAQPTIEISAQSIADGGDYVGPGRHHCGHSLAHLAMVPPAALAVVPINGDTWTSDEHFKLPNKRITRLIRPPAA